MVDLVHTFQEDIIKAFKGTLDPKQIETLVQMHEETRMLQLAVSEMHKMHGQIIEALQLSQKERAYYKGLMEKFEKKFSDDPDTVVSEEYDG